MWSLLHKNQLQYSKLVNKESLYIIESTYIYIYIIFLIFLIMLKVKKDGERRRNNNA